MQRLTVISLCLMFPTFITGFFGMNVNLPGQGIKWAWIVLAGICATVAIVGSIVINHTNNRSVMRANKGIIPKKKREKNFTPSEIKYMRRKKATMEEDD